nr:MAG TPA: hypothetical protein [Caudoviricetes sp.]
MLNLMIMHLQFLPPYTFLFTVFSFLHQGYLSVFVSFWYFLPFSNSI